MMKGRIWRNNKSVKSSVGCIYSGIHLQKIRRKSKWIVRHKVIKHLTNILVRHCWNQMIAYVTKCLQQCSTPPWIRPWITAVFTSYHGTGLPCGDPVITPWLPREFPVIWSRVRHTLNKCVYYLMQSETWKSKRTKCQQRESIQSTNTSIKKRLAVHFDATFRSTTRTWHHTCSNC
jgi:hypothetical protein